MRGRLLLGTILLAGAAYFAVFGGDYDLFDLRRVRHERALEQARAESTRADVARLRARRDSLATDSATIERLARERYGLVRDGERLYRFADEPDEPAADSAGN
ncbi:MAG: septum formation initiator family protein [Gemmatimonadota bacterium]